MSVCCGDHDDSGCLAMVMGMSFHGLLEALKARNDDGVIKLPMPPPYTLNHEHLVVLGLQTKHMLSLLAHNSQISKEKKLHHKRIHMCVIHCSLIKSTKKNKKTHGS
jgi:hypothetical protein